MRLAAVFVAFIATSAGVLFAPAAHSLALGEIQLQSRLNEPLAATIPLIVADSQEFQSLRVSVASPEAFARAGLQYDDYLGSVVLSLSPARGLTPPQIVVSSREIAREPFVDLMIEAKSSSGRILRNYTLLLDPPRMAAPTVAPGVQAPASRRPVPPPSPSADYALTTPAAPAAKAPTPPAPVVQAPEDDLGPANTQRPTIGSDDPAYFSAGAGWVPADDEPTATAADGSARDAADPAPGTRYGPVGKKETLWSIAYRLRPDPSITMDQMQLAIYRANPDAFAGNINRLLTGATLRIPSERSIRQVDAASAKREVARQRASYVPPADATMAAPERSRPAPVDAAPEPAQDQAPAVADVEFEDEVDAGIDDAGEDDSLYAPIEPAPVADMEDADPIEPATEPAQPQDEDALPDEPAAPVAEPAPAAQAGTEPAQRRPLSALDRLRADRAAKAEPGAVPDAEPAADDAPAGDVTPEPVLDTPTEDPAASDFTDAPADVPLAEPAVDVAEDVETADEPSAADTTAAPPPSAPLNAPAEGDSGGLPWGLIGGLLLALLAGGAALLGLRRRKSAKAAPQAVASPAAVPADTEDDDDTPDQAAEDGDRMGDTAVIEEADYGLGDTAKPKPREDVVPDVPVIDAPDGGLDDTARMDAAEAQPADATPEDASEPDPDADAMAATMQFDANTISLDLSGDDPVSEADVHLAYGATDEAASVMEQAVAAAPDNPAYAAKLAEIYFTANDRDKFVQHVAATKAAMQAGSGEAWQKVLILGQQIAPDDALFADAGAAELQSADFDFGSDPEDVEDTVTGDDEDFSLDLDDEAPVAADAPATPATDDAATDDNSLEFDLDSLDMPAADAPEPATAEAPTAETEADDGGIEFDLGDFDLDEGEDKPDTADETPDADDGLAFDLDEADTPAAAPATDDAQPDEGAGDDSIDLDALGLDLDADDSVTADADDALSDLGDFDLDGETSDEDTPAEDEDAGAALDESSLEALLGDDVAGDDDVLDADADDAATKLDLARAYMDMGDKDLAESLLNDVVEAGDEAQQDEARTLLGKLGGDASG